MSVHRDRWRSRELASAFTVHRRDWGGRCSFTQTRFSSDAAYRPTRRARQLQAPWQARYRDQRP